MQERGTAAALTRPRRVASSTRRSLVVVAVAAVVVAADQVTKTLAVRHLSDGPAHLVWTLRLNLVYNTGGAFGLGGGFVPLFVVAAVVLGVVLLGLGPRLSGVVGLIALGLVLGGALGNLADRIFRDAGGGVVDFIDLHWWPVFNVADASIVCGGVLLVLRGTRA